MDLSVVKDALSDFNTLISGVADLFRAFPKFIADFAEFFAPSGTEADAPTNGEVWSETTSSLFGGGEGTEGGSSKDAADK